MLHYRTPCYATLRYTKYNYSYNCNDATLHYITLDHTTLHYPTLHYTTLTTPQYMQLQLRYTNYTTPHGIQKVVGEVTDQVATAITAATPKTQFQSPCSPSVGSLGHL